MADPKGFLTTPRELPQRRPVDVRIQDWREVYEEFPEDHTSKQAGRCMDCGIPFCHNGCPLGNLIPEWNELVWRAGLGQAASERLHATNNFPEFTGRLCPAPCETACVLGINAGPGHDQAGRGRDRRPGLVTRAGSRRTLRHRVRPGKHRRRHRFRPGGSCGQLSSSPGPVTRSPCLRTGLTGSVGCCATASPSSRWRSATSTVESPRCSAEGVKFRCGCRRRDVDVTGTDLRRRYDAVVVAVGATQWPATCRSPGRELAGVHQAMEFLPRRQPGPGGRSGAVAPIDVAGKHVVIIGGGDTGADCLGTVAPPRCAASVTQLEILPHPSDESRPDAPSRGRRTRMTYRRSLSAHEEGGERLYLRRQHGSASSTDGHGVPGRVRALELVEVRMFRDGRFEPVRGQRVHELPG